MLHDAQAAEDAVHDASLTAWRKLDRVRDEGKIRPGFLSIVANECRNARRQKWVTSVNLGLPELSMHSSEERVLRGVDLRRALAQLNEQDRLVVVLYFYLDLPLEEVAPIVGTSVGAAKARLYRSIRRSSAVDAGQGPVTVLGVGPAYAVGNWHGATATTWGTYSDWLIATVPSLTGLVLVRGRDLEANLPVVFVGPHSAGSPVGTDTIAGKAVQQRSEAVFDAGRHDPAVSGTSKWGMWPMKPGVDKSESGCIAFQIDGPSFSEVVISVDVPTDHHH